MKLLLEIRSIDLDSTDLDEAVAALAYAKTIISEYGVQAIPAPDWLTEKVGELDREVKMKRRDLLMRRRAAALARQATYKSREEKQRDAAAEIAEIDKLLSQ